MKRTFLFLLIVFCSFSVYSQSLDDGLLLHYPFTFNCEDISGNGFHGDAHATLTTDKDCNLYSAYSFNGEDEYIDFPLNNDLKPELPVSFSFWVKFRDLSAQKAVIFTTDYCLNNHTGVWMNLSSNGYMGINYGDGDGTTSPEARRTKLGTTPIESGIWYHVVGIVKGPEDMDIYINGVNDGGSYNGSGANIQYTDNPGSIGRKDVQTVPPYYFDGIIDDFRYWNRVITEEEVQELYMPDNGLLLFYTFNENANDYSGNDFHGISNADLTLDRYCNEDHAMSFNGIDQYVDFPNESELKPGLPVSFTYWIKFDDLSPDNSVIFTTDYAQNNHTGVWMNLSSSGYMCLSFGDNTGNTSPSNRRTKVGNTLIDTLQWYHIAGIVRGAEDMDIYINCMNDGGTYNGYGGDLAYTSNPGTIGRKDVATMPPYHFKGKIDEFKYYNREISISEIFEDYFSNPCSQPISVYDTTFITLVDSISVTDTLIIDVELSIAENEYSRIKVYPNPSSDIVNIAIEDYDLLENYSVEIINESGRLIFESYLNSSILTVNLRQFGSYGLYFIKIRDEENQIIHVRKIILI